LAAGWDGGVNYSGSIQLTSGNILLVGVGGDLEYGFRTTAVFRDPSAWYHVVAAWNRGAAAADKVKVWVNGVAQTSTDTGYQSWTSGNCQIFCPNTANRIGRGDGDRYGNYLDGYLAEYFFIDGQALDPTSFGEFDATTGVWVPKAYSGTYGTNGFRLDFADNASTTTIGYDAAGSNDWTANNLSVTAGAGNDSLVDTPTSYGTDTGAGGEVRGNYCTWNPVDTVNTTLTDGALLATVGGGGTSLTFGTIGLTSGKWYWEVTPTSIQDQSALIGIAAINQSRGSRNYAGAYGWYYYSFNGNTYSNNTSLSYGSAYVANDVIGVALNMDAGTLVFYKNGVSQGTAFSSGLVGNVIAPAVNNGSGSGVQVCVLNAGQRPFAYTAPSGFKALCTANLPAPTIVKPSTVFDTKLYTGNGSTQTISGLGFSPDLVWVKIRSGVGRHTLEDTVRGATKNLFTSETYAEETDANSITALTSDGFSLGNNTTGSSNVNVNSSTYVAWCWDAGSTTVTNTQGSITSSVRANPSAGFSVVTYTGTGSGGTIGHGLNAAPQLVFQKIRNTTGSWQVYHASIGATKFLNLDTTDAAVTSSLRWNDTAPTSTVVTVGTVGGSAYNYVLYCFAPVAGLSSFGSYTGNGSTDGTFVYTGFRPRWLLIKRSDIANDWGIFDSARNGSNLVNLKLFPNRGEAENSVWTSLENNLDILSNGFKLRSTNAATNASGGTLIYAAFAEAPFQYARAR
jgi:hypothetical protein